MARARKPAEPATVSWTNDDGETIVLPQGVTPGDTAAATAPQQAANGNGAAADEPESAADRVVEMIVRNRERDRSKVKVWKVLESGELSFCNDYAPDLFEQQNLNLIRRQFGAGKYRIEIYAHNPISKRFSCFGREIVHIEDVNTGSSDDPEGMIEKIVQRLAPSANPAAETAPKSQIEQLKEMMSLALLFREAFGFNTKPAPPPPQPSMAQQLGELLTIMKGAKELAAEVDPPPEASDPLLAIANQALPIIARAIEGQQSAPAVLNPVHLPPTLAAVPAANASQPENAAVNTDEFNALRDSIRGINTFAVMKANTELTATLIFEKIPDEAFPILESSDWFAKLCQIEPACGKHQAWYTEVRNFLVKFWNEPDETTTDGEAQQIDPQPRAA